jgi:hypothetical protein
VIIDLAAVERRISCQDLCDQLKYAAPTPLIDSLSALDVPAEIEKCFDPRLTVDTSTWRQSVTAFACLVVAVTRDDADKKLDG